MSILGRPRSERRKEKATVTEYPQLAHVTIDEAHRQLSPSAFVFWLRILGESEAHKLGRRATAKLTRYSYRRAEELYQELYRKGYITFAPAMNGGSRQAVVILRRLIVGADSGFIRLS